MYKFNLNQVLHEMDLDNNDTNVINTQGPEYRGSVNNGIKGPPLQQPEHRAPVNNEIRGTSTQSDQDEIRKNLELKKRHDLLDKQRKANEQKAINQHENQLKKQEYNEIKAARAEYRDHMAQPETKAMYAAEEAKVDQFRALHNTEGVKQDTPEERTIKLYNAKLEAQQRANNNSTNNTTTPQNDPTNTDKSSLHPAIKYGAPIGLAAGATALAINRQKQNNNNNNNRYN